jgi:hypothetical protein
VRLEGLGQLKKKITTDTLREDLNVFLSASQALLAKYLLERKRLEQTL